MLSYKIEKKKQTQNFMNCGISDGAGPCHSRRQGLRKGENAVYIFCCILLGFFFFFFQEVGACCAQLVHFMCFLVIAMNLYAIW